VGVAVSLVMVAMHPMAARVDTATMPMIFFLCMFA
jgi:hypothetical protein